MYDVYITFQIGLMVYDFKIQEFVAKLELRDRFLRFSRQQETLIILYTYISDTETYLSRQQISKTKF